MTIEIKVPDIGVEEVEVTEILVKIGDKIDVEQPLIIVEGNKASIEIPSPQAGILRDIKVSVGDQIETGKLIMIFDPLKKIESPTLMQEKEVSVTKFQDKLECIKNYDHSIHATPLIRRLARELDIDLTKVKGTGRQGRILREDIQNYVKETTKGIEVKNMIHSSLSKVLPIQEKINLTKFGETEEVELTKIQKISGANLSHNWTTIPHVTHFDKVDITNLEEFRKRQNLEAEKLNLGIKITLIVFIMKVVASALEQMPRFNSSLSNDGHHLILKKYINIGIAVDTPSGLVVPVFKDVNKKGVIELTRELMYFTKKARSGALTISEMQGGCFTISSIGNLGTTYFSPIINAPEVAILGISKSKIEPVWNAKEFVPRLMLPISLSFDHRVIDGADGARFISTINTILSDIRCLVM